MTEIAIDNPPVEQRNRPSSVSILLPLMCFISAMFMAADFTAIYLRPLHVLQIPYPKAMDYAHFIIPVGCALVWLSTVLKWPKASSILSVLLCFTLISQIPVWAERRVSRLPVIRWLETGETQSFKSRNGFPIYQVGTKEGLFVVVAPGNAVRARKELNRLGVLRASEAVAE